MHYEQDPPLLPSNRAVLRLWLPQFSSGRVYTDLHASASAPFVQARGPYVTDISGSCTFLTAEFWTRCMHLEGGIQPVQTESLSSPSLLDSHRIAGGQDRLAILTFSRIIYSTILPSTALSISESLPCERNGLSFRRGGGKKREDVALCPVNYPPIQHASLAPELIPSLLSPPFCLLIFSANCGVVLTLYFYFAPRSKVCLQRIHHRDLSQNTVTPRSPSV